MRMLVEKDWVKKQVNFNLIEVKNFISFLFVFHVVIGSL